MTRTASVPRGSPGLVEPARRGDRDLAAGHLARQLDHARGQPGAVRDDDDPDHRRPSALSPSP